MDIQRGDQAYYRGEVWLVYADWSVDWNRGTVAIARKSPDGKYESRYVSPSDVQRVEQVR